MKPRIYEQRNTLVCLVPRKGVGGITCHEKTICDCQVLELFAYADQLEKELTQAQMQIACLKDPYNFPEFLADFQSLSDENKEKINNLAKALKQCKPEKKDA